MAAWRYDVVEQQNAVLHRENIGPNTAIIRNVFSREECRAIIARAPHEAFVQRRTRWSLSVRKLATVRMSWVVSP